MTITKRFDDLLILFALCWAAVVTVSRAFIWPHDWAKAHWLISYDFGFLKRGFPGTLFLPFANENAELAIKIVSTSLFGLFCILLLWVCMRTIKNESSTIGSFLITLLFVTSPFLVMSAHLNGYYDNILIVLTIISCVLIKKNRVVFSAILISIGVLVHETIFVVGFPSVLFFSLLQYEKQAPPSSTTHMILGFLSKFKLLIGLPVVVFLCVFLNQTFFLDSEELKVQLIIHLSQFEFFNQDKIDHVPDAITHSFINYIYRESPHFFHRIADPVYLLRVGLPLSILLIFGIRKLQEIGSKWPIYLIFTVVTLWPLSLHLIAYDTSRIWTYPLVVGLINIWGITETHPGIRKDKTHTLFFIILTIIIIVFQLFITIPLMGNFHERFSIGNRLILYAPSLLLFAVYVSKNYGLTKRYD